MCREIYLRGAFAMALAIAIFTAIPASARNFSGGNRAKAFLGVQTVGGAVAQIVHEIDRAGSQAKEREGGEDVPDRRRMGQLFSEDDAGEKEAILDPMLRSRLFQQRSPQRPARRERDIGHATIKRQMCLFR